MSGDNRITVYKLRDSIGLDWLSLDKPDPHDEAEWIEDEFVIEIKKGTTKDFLHYLSDALDIYFKWEIKRSR